MSPSCATPSVMDVKTRGTTVISKSRRKIWPTGPAMTVVPLVFTSITLGVAQLGDIRRVGRIGVRSLAYFFLSTLISAVIGIVLVNLVRPGVGVSLDVRQQLLDAYRGQVAGPSGGGAPAFGVDFFVKIVP